MSSPQHCISHTALLFDPFIPLDSFTSPSMSSIHTILYISIGSLESMSDNMVFYFESDFII